MLFRSWAQNTVSTILKNSIYTGKMIQHQKEMFDPIAKIQRSIPESDWIIKHVDNIRIIDVDLYEIVQDEMNERKKLLGITKVEMSEPDEEGNRERLSTQVINRQGRYSGEHIFSNILYCNHCGVGMKRKKRKSYKRRDGSKKDLGYEWTCTMRDLYGKHKCYSVWRNRIVEDELLLQVKEIVKEVLENKRGTSFKEYFSDYLTLKLGDNQVEKLPEIEKEIEETKQDMKSYAKQLARGKMEQETYDELYEEDSKKLEELKKQKEIINNLDSERKIVKRRKNDIMEFIQNHNIEEIDNSFLRKIIKKIKIDSNPMLLNDNEDWTSTIFIDWNFGLDTTEEELWQLGIEQYEKDHAAGLV